MEDIFIDVTDNGELLIAYDLEKDMAMVTKGADNNLKVAMLLFSASPEMYKKMRDGEDDNNFKITMHYCNDDGISETKTLNDGIVLYSRNTEETEEKTSGETLVYTNHDPEHLDKYICFSASLIYKTLREIGLEKAEIFDLIAKNLETYAKDDEIGDNELEAIIGAYTSVLKGDYSEGINFDYIWRYRSDIVITEKDLEAMMHMEVDMDEETFYELEEKRALTRDDIRRAKLYREKRVEFYRRQIEERIKKDAEDIAEGYSENKETEGMDGIQGEIARMLVNGIIAVQCASKDGFVKMKKMIEGAGIYTNISPDAYDKVKYFYVRERTLRMTNIFSKTGADSVAIF